VEDGFMKIKRLLAAALVISTMATTVACSKGGSKDGSESKSGGKTTITFWHSMDGVYADILDKQVKKFNSTIGDKKGITVKPVFQNYPGTEVLKAAMSANNVANMPDVIQMYGENVSMIRDYKRTVWAEDYISKSTSTLKKEDLIPNSVSSVSIDGKMIGVPYSVSALITKVPTTIDEMAKIMPDLVSKAGAQDALNVRVNQYELENWISTQGDKGTFFGDNESGHNGNMMALEADKNGSLMKFLTEWEKVINTNAYKSTKDSMNEEFAKGMHSMVIMTSSKIPTIASLVGNSFEWGVAPIPTVDSKDIGGAYASGSALYMLDRDDKAKVDASWEFIQYMASAEAQVMWLDGAGYVPVNIKAQQLDEYKAAMKKEPRLQAPYDALMKASTKVVPSYTPNSSSIDTVVKNAMLNFASKKANKEETYNTIVQGCKKAIDDYYRTNPVK